MFTKKPKLDSKVRFQQVSFRRQLQDARDYKRTSRKIPESKTAIFFERIWLGNTQRKIIAGIAIAFVFYLIYFPTFIFVKTISVEGADAETSYQVTESAWSYIKKNPLLPRRNLLLLSKTNLKKYIESTNGGVAVITQITKRYPHTIIIQTQPRVPTFIVGYNSGEYVVANDGKVLDNTSTIASTSPLLLLPKVVIKNTSSEEAPNYAFSESKAHGIQDFIAKTSEQLQTSVERVELLDEKAMEATLYLKNGLKLFINFAQDTAKTLHEAKLIWDNTQVGDRKNIYYIDLRYEDRGYTCFKNTPCAEPPRITTPSTTPETINTKQDGQ